MSALPERKKENERTVPDGVPPPTIRRGGAARLGLAALLIVLGYFLGSFLLDRLQQETVDLSIEMSVSRADDQTFEVYINNNFYEPLRAPLQKKPGRAKYLFRAVPAQTHTIRFDPTNLEDVHLEIFGASFRSGDGTQVNISAETMAAWPIYNGTAKYNSETGSLSVDTGEDVRLEGTVELPFPNPYIPISLKTLEERAPFWLFASVGCLFVALGNPRLFLVLGVLLAALFPALRAIVSWRTNIQGPLSSVANAVGYASYHGISKGQEFQAFWYAALATFGAFVLFGLLLRNRSWFPAGRFGSENDTRAPLSGLLFTAVVVIAGVYTFPDIRGMFLNGPSTLYHTSYDAQNFFSWHYFLYRNLLPLKDFWYPYTGMYLLSFGTPFPSPGVTLYGFLHVLTLFSVCFYGLYYFLGGSKSKFLLAALTIGFYFAIGRLDRLDRYLMPIDIVMLFGIALSTGRYKAFVAWGAFTVYVFLLEPSQLVYAAPSCALMFVATLFNPPRSRKDSILGLVVGGVTVALGCALVIGKMYLHGQFGEFAKLYLNMAPMADYGMLSADILSWISFPKADEMWLILLTFSALAVSTALCASRFPKRLGPEDMMPLALSIVSLFFLQKQIVRPPITGQIISASFVAWLLLLNRIGSGPFVTRRALMGSALFLGFTLPMLSLCFIHMRGIPYTEYLQRLPRGLPEQLRLFGSPDEDWDKLAKGVFRPNAYTIDGVSGEEWRAILKNELDLAPSDLIYVFGDDAFFYPILGQRPPFYITIYNQSIEYSQKETIHWLLQKRPRFVLWRPAFHDFDFVPNLVRVPLLYNFMVEHYVSYKTLGNFQVLRLRENDEAISLDYWKSLLGNHLDLGYVPAAHREVHGGTELRPVLTITSPAPEEKKIRTLSLEVEGKPFTISFRERAGTTKYTVLLDRLWFWKLAHSENKTPKISSTENGMSFVLTEEAIPSSVLF